MLMEPSPSSAAPSGGAAASSSSVSSSSNIVPASSPLANDPAAIATLLDDLRNGDVSVRINSFRHLPVIARALGPERTREELVPYLNEFVDDDDDILVVLAEALVLFPPFLGGDAYLPVLLEPLETLASVEEVAVRDKAVAGLSTVIGLLSDTQAVRSGLPVFRHLVSSEWFTSRVSACHVFLPLYQRLPDALRKEMRAAFAQLCVDESPIVRRAACTHLVPVLAVVTPQQALADFTGAFVRLTKDEQDSVRLLSVSVCVAMANVCRPLSQVQRVLPTVFALCTDRSWRVRFMAADKFPDLATSVGASDIKGDDLAECFVRLLGDSEPEVRTAAAGRVAATAQHFGPQRTHRSMLAAVRGLVQDASHHTRASLAKNIVGLTSVLTRNQVFEDLLPLILQLLRDPLADVRINLISQLEAMNDVVGLDVLAQALLPAVCQLALDKEWRVRHSIIELLPSLAKLLGPQFFEARLAELTMSWLGDRVASVRAAATGNLSRIAAAFGPEWALANIIPKVNHLATRRGHIYRLTALSAARDLLHVLGPEKTAAALLPVVKQLAEDRVANVRLVAAIVLGEIGIALQQHVKAAPADSALVRDIVHGQITPLLEVMARDADSEARHRAETALVEVATGIKTSGATEIELGIGGESKL